MTDDIDLMTSPTLTISLDDREDRFRLGGSTFIHKERISSIPGSRFVGGGADYWTVPRSWPALKVLARLFPSLSWDPEVVEWANSIWSGLVEPSTLLRTSGADPAWVEAVSAMLPPNIRTYDYQVAGAIYLATARRAMLFDEQGTGKMVQTALTLSLYPETLPALVIAPKGVVYAWQNILKLFSINSVVVDGSAAERRKQFEEFESGEATVLIISYGLLAKHSRVSGFGTIKLSEEHKQHKELQQTRWATVVADEAHRIKEPTAVQTRAAWACRDGAKFVWALTGTPIEQSILDFWALLHFIDPIEWPSKTKFIDMWVETAPQYFGGIDIIGLRHETEEEFRALTEWHWRRVLLDKSTMPPVEFDFRNAFMDAKGKKAYRDMKKQLMAEVDSDGSFSTLFAENHMVKTGRLHAMASSTIRIDEDDNVRMIEPSWKLDAVEEAMEDYEGQPTIYWFVHRDLLAMFAARLTKKDIPYVEIHGDVTGIDRQRAVEAFQNGEVDHILVTYGAGSEGTTLTRAPVAFRVQRPFSSLQDQQAPARNNRIGSEIHDRITYVDLVTKDTMEEDLIETHRDKIATQQEILRDGGPVE